MPRVLGGWAISHERGSPVGFRVSGFGVRVQGSEFVFQGSELSVHTAWPGHADAVIWENPKLGAVLILGFIFVYYRILGDIRLWVGPRKEHRLSS